MQQVAIEKLRDWKQSMPGQDSYMIPASLDCICGFCNTLANLQTSAYSQQPEIQSLSMKGRCTRCQKESIVYLIKPNKFNEHNAGIKCGECWVHPMHSLREFKFKEEDFPIERIFLDYKEAIETFNEGRPRSSINSCGVVVEGIAKTNFPNASTTRQISKLFEKLRTEIVGESTEIKEILKPIHLLGEALAVGRNMSPHFDIEGQPDKDLASKIIDLTEFLIQYFYTLSSETNVVKEIISNLKSQAIK